MKRRQFLARVARSALAAPLAMAAIGCATEEHGQYEPITGSPTGGGGGGGGGGADLTFAVENSDDSGHAHSFEIRCSHVDADGWTYTADGAHTHEVRLSRDDLAEIFAGGTVTVTSNDGHPHTWVIRMPTGMC